MSDLDVVIEFLRDDGWPVAVDPDDPGAVETKTEGEAGIWLCEARADEHHCLVFVSVSPTPVPPSGRSSLAELIVRINARLVLEYAPDIQALSDGTS